MRAERLSRAQREVLHRMYEFWKLNPHAWISFKGRCGGMGMPQMVALRRAGLLDLNHFVGYRITPAGRAAVKGEQDGR